MGSRTSLIAVVILVVAVVVVPYCDQVSDEYMRCGGICHDRKDYSDTTGLYTCRDGTHEVHWEDCR